MNCFIEVLGLFLLGNGFMLVIYVDCKNLFEEVGCFVVLFVYCWYGDGDEFVLLWNIVNFWGFENVMIVDIVMGGLINMVFYFLVVV